MYSKDGSGSAPKSNADYETKLLYYLLECFLSEGSKILLFTIFSLKYHCLLEFLTALSMLMLLRTNGGGIHCRHYCGCFLLSFMALFGSIFLAVHISCPVFFMQGVTVGCAFIGYRFVPAISANRPPPTLELIKRCKKNTLFLILAFFILICIFPNNLYIRIGFWTMILHIGQLLLAVFLQKERGT